MKFICVYVLVCAYIYACAHVACPKATATGKYKYNTVLQFIAISIAAAVTDYYCCCCRCCCYCFCCCYCCYVPFAFAIGVVVYFCCNAYLHITSVELKLWDHLWAYLLVLHVLLLLLLLLPPRLPLCAVHYMPSTCCSVAVSLFLLFYMFASPPYINRLFARSFVRSVASAAIVQTIVVVVYLVEKQKTKNGRNIVCKVIFVFHFGLLLLKWLRLALCFCHKGF